QTIIAPTYAVYLRKKFTIVDKSDIETMILQADYDDGFVAYLNGVEIGRANIDGNPPLYDTDTNTDHEATLYSIGQVESTFLDAALVEELLQEGENTLAIQVHNRFGSESSDMTANFYLTLGIKNTDRAYRSTPEWFVAPFENSTLPLIRITTSRTINSQQRIDGTLEIVNNASGNNSFFDEANEYSGPIAVKFRGQSSLSFPKKNYSLETRDAAGEDLDTTFLNFPPEEDWVLHGPFSDKSLMRNVLTMELARRMGQYASKTQYVELYVNGDYQGIYVLMENIKRGEGRVDIAKLRDVDIEGDELTGGYIYKIDKDAADWRSNFGVQNNVNRKLEYQLVYPDIDKVQPEQFAYIQSYVDSFERAMRNPNLEYGGKSYDEYIDLKSFAEAHLLNELGRNVDGYRLSSYFHKQKDSDGGKIYAGPVWDFNLAYRNADYCNGDAIVGLIYYRFCDNNYPFWWDKLFKTEEFTNLTKCRWEELRRGPFHTDSIFAFIDEQVEYLQPALSRNFQKWNIFGRYVWPNPSPLANSYPQEIDLMKTWIERRLNWMDVGVLGDCTIVSTEEVDVEKPFQISPNPA
ncbi:MAG: CotH kinase family protein, partial [Bacteroidota bacterium]